MRNCFKCVYLPLLHCKENWISEIDKKQNCKYWFQWKMVLLTVSVCNCLLKQFSLVRITKFIVHVDLKIFIFILTPWGVVVPLMKPLDINYQEPHLQQNFGGKYRFILCVKYNFFIFKIQFVSNSRVNYSFQSFAMEMLCTTKS